MLKFNVRAMIKRARPATKRVFVLADIVPTLALRSDLERIYMRVVRAWWEASRDGILPAYRRALAQAKAPTPGLVLDDTNELSSLLDDIALTLERLILSITPDLSDWVIRVERWHRERFATSFTPTGVNLRTLIGPEDARETMQSVLTQNVALVRNVSEESRNRISQIVFRGFNQRADPRQIAKEISASVAMSRKRALRIAADQTVKLSSDLDTERFRQAGLDEFEWRHSGKIHYRPWHKERDGKRFKLEGEIDPSDMPGQPVGCGCRKRAVLDLDD
jgi:SPP1 gp7 family putative phage head morphogenesis protein